MKTSSPDGHLPGFRLAWSGPEAFVQPHRLCGRLRPNPPACLCACVVGWQAPVRVTHCQWHAQIGNGLRMALPLSLVPVVMSMSSGSECDQRQYVGATWFFRLTRIQMELEVLWGDDCRSASLHPSAYRYLASGFSRSSVVSSWCWGRSPRRSCCFPFNESVALYGP